MEYEKKVTKKKKHHVNKTKLWNMFDSEMGTEKQQIECIYRNSGEREYCDTCQSSLAFTEQGFLECTNKQCCIVYKDVLDSSAEWRFYGADDNQSSDPTRCGMPINPLLKESSFGCKVICDGRSSYEMRKIRRYTEWQSMPYKEKSQYDEFQRITTMAHNSGISKLIIDDAVRYHKMISEQKTFRGLNRDGIIAASIYISCRINDHPRTAKEIATIFHLDTTSATKGCKNATSIINTMEVDVNNENKTNLGTTNPCDFIDRYCSRLNMNSELTKLCKFIAVRIEKNNIMPENTPHSIASGVIYFVCMNCELNINKKDIHNISEISEVTINKCYKKLDAIRNELLPKAIINKYIK
jgi:transcription initiation factor TFIIB